MKLILDRALGAYEVVADATRADVIFRSLFGPAAPEPERTIGIIWENVRPGYGSFAHSLSSDFDTYGGRNCRLPFWYGQLKWPGLVPNRLTFPPTNHGFEAPVDIDALMRPRPDWSSIRHHGKFCCFIANNAEVHRLRALEALREIGAVDFLGNAGGRPLKASKYTVLPGYRFNLCFENSLFPGYYTEKPLHAWVGGCVPLYYADPWFHADFNPKAVVNRAAFRTLTDFAHYVQELDRSPARFDDIAAEPLLTRRPSLDEPIEFVARITRKIVDSAPRRVFTATALPSAPAASNSVAPAAVRKIGRNEPCPCGSGRKYKYCHGA